jgi:AcrR family transcriptional regulator
MTSLRQPKLLEDVIAFVLLMQGCAMTSLSSMPKASARQRIFDTALELFYQHGIRAVGVDAIAEAAGATKMTLYRNFPSKDELAAECLREQEKSFWQWWNDLCQQHPRPEAKVLALFDGFMAKSKSCGSRGCALANVAVEIADDDHPARKVAVSHKQNFRAALHGLCRDMQAQDPEQLGDALMLLIEGGYLSRLTLGGDGPAQTMKMAAKILMQAHGINTDGL